MHRRSITYWYHMSVWQQGLVRYAIAREHKRNDLARGVAWSCVSSVYYFVYWFVSKTETNPYIESLSSECFFFFVLLFVFVANTDWPHCWPHFSRAENSVSRDLSVCVTHSTSHTDKHSHRHIFDIMLAGWLAGSSMYECVFQACTQT